MATEFTVTIGEGEAAIVENYKVTLVDGTATFSTKLEDDTWQAGVVQPWKCEADGSRVSWTDEAEAVLWYKADKGEE
tara:strand:- start:1195 stop:1425 length:231 start_codon:yes stop_codon:yes gene_type:complete